MGERAVPPEAEERLRIEVEEQNALNAILRVSLEDMPLDRQFEQVLDILLRLSWLPIEPKGGIFRADERRETLILKAQRNLAPPLLTACARVPYGFCLCGRAAATREIQYAGCLDPRHEISYAGIRPHGHYNVPILSRRGLLGVIVLYLKDGHVRNDREMHFLESVANTLAGMIEHRLVQEALDASRARLAEAQRIAHLGGWEWDVAGDDLQCSDETYRILGLPPGRSPLAMEAFLSPVHADDRDAVWKAVDRAVAEGLSFGVDARIVRTDGTEAVVHLQAEATAREDGKAARLAGTVQDVTKRKKAEELLRQSATVFESTTEGVMITDAVGRIIAVNRAFTEITGYPREEAVGSTAALLKSGRHDEDFYASMWSAIRATGSWQGEVWNRRRNGDVFPEWLNISAVRDDHGELSQFVGVFSDISAMKESESRLDHLAHHDPLTGLPNRLLLTARMEHAIAWARRNNRMLAVMFLDLDHFKNINDTLGHPIGDLLLQEAARRLSACVREEDTVTRLGGDEFTVLLEDLNDSRLADEAAQRIIAALAGKFSLQGHEMFITCSVGISVFPNDGGDITTLFKNADSALYRAKEQGRNNYQYYTEELTTRAMERMAMEVGLRHALERDELVLHYQPQVDLYNGRVIGMEALLRWRHPEIGLIAPATFIPLAEETGLIIPIGEWVLRTACARLKSWIDAGLPEVTMAVNLSSRQFNQKDLYETVVGVLHDTGLPPRLLELELTESLIMRDAETAISILTRLKALGVQFSIDDFGTGYSSLSYLKRLPIDRLKIDQSFVRNITSEPEDAAVSQAIISMSHSLNLKTVAEGVETAEQREFLRLRECDEVQGFHFSHPLPEAEMERFLKNPPDFGGQRPESDGEKGVLLLIDDDRYVLDALVRVLRREGYRILCATRPEEALDLLATHRVGVVVSDLRLPGMSGLDLLRKVRVLHPDTVRIMLTGHADLQAVTTALNESEIYKLIFKPWSNEQLRQDVRKAFQHHARIARLPRQQ